MKKFFYKSLQNSQKNLWSLFFKMKFMTFCLQLTVSDTQNSFFLKTSASGEWKSMIETNNRHHTRNFTLGGKFSISNQVKKKLCDTLFSNQDEENILQRQCSLLYIYFYIINVFKYLFLNIYKKVIYIIINNFFGNVMKNLMIPKY